MTGNQVLLLTAVLSAFVVSLLAVRMLARGAFDLLHVLDHPNERSLHENPVPRNGGVGLLLGLLAAAIPVALLAERPLPLAAIAAAAAMVALVSWLDDHYDMSRKLRLAVHFGAGILLIVGGIGWTGISFSGTSVSVIALDFPRPLVWVLTLLFVVWMTNLYNFMDGMDGFAGGMSLFGFATLAVLGYQGGAEAFTALNAAIAAAAAGFLLSNFPPASIFLGDVGSSTLGLLAAAMSLWGAELGLFPIWAAWLAFSPFIIDATWTLIRRALKRERIWEAHRSHHYQRLVLAGWSHKRTLVRAYVLMAAAACSAMAAVGMTGRDQLILLLAWAGIYALVHIKVSLIEAAGRADAP